MKIEVKKSKIEGTGVFAEEDIKKGEIILSMDDSNVVADVNSLTTYQQDYECDWLADSKVILMQAPEKHINHSCDPNTYVKTIDGIRKVVAMRDIKQGEELTYDYAINGYYDCDTPCRCKSNICRGTISPNFFKLPRNRQLDYLPYLDDWFKEKFKVELENEGFSIK